MVSEAGRALGRRGEMAVRGKVGDWRWVTGVRLTVLGWEAGGLKGTTAGKHGSLGWESPQ